MSDAVLESQSLRLAIDGVSGAFDVVIKATGARWERDPWERSAGELLLRSRRGGRAVGFDLSKSESVTVSAADTAPSAVLEFRGLRSDDGQLLPDGLVRTAIALEDSSASVSVIVDEVSVGDEWEFVSLHYPCRFGALRTLVDTGFLVLPFLQGCLVPSHHFPRQASEFWNIDDEYHSVAAETDLPTHSHGGLRMSWAGVTGGGGGWLAILETGDDAGIRVVANYDRQDRFDRRRARSPYPRIAAISPWWRPSLGGLRYPRRATLRFLPRANHVSLAKAYREHARQAGLFRPLAEKIAAKPHVERLVGATCVNLYGAYPHYTDYPTMNWTFEDVARVGRDVVEGLGLRRLYLNLWGGYTHLPPDSWPFDLRKGDVGVLARAIDEVQAAGLIFAIYHGYPPMLERNAPWHDDALKHTAEGGMPPGRWDRTCSSQFVRFARTNMPRILEQVRPLADFPDIVTAADLTECYNPAHRQSRSEDRRSKIALFEFLSSLGLVVGSENAREWAVPHTEYQRGAMYRVHPRPLYLFSLRAPLWQMVYHECGPVFRQDAEGYTRTDTGDYQTKCLEDLAFGVNPLFSIAFRDWSAWRLKVKEAQDLVGRFAGEVAQQEMTGHELLSADGAVFQTTFESGTSVTVNLGVGPHDLGAGEPLPGYGYLIRRAEGGARGAAVERGRYRVGFERIP